MSKVIQHDKWTISCESIGSVATCITVKELKLCFDMGITSDIHDVTNYSTVVISHGHCDHNSRLHFHAKVRSRKELSPPIYILPKECVMHFSEFYNARNRLDSIFDDCLNYSVVVAT